MHIHLIIVWVALLRRNCVCDLITLLGKCRREREFGLFHAAVEGFFLESTFLCLITLQTIFAA